MKKFAKIILLFVVIWVITFSCLHLIANADAADPEQHRVVMFLPVLLQQCRAGQDCAVVEPTAQPECDLKYWWECP